MTHSKPKLRKLNDFELVVMAALFNSWPDAFYAPSITRAQSIQLILNLIQNDFLHEVKEAHTLTHDKIEYYLMQRSKALYKPMIQSAVTNLPELYQRVEVLTQQRKDNKLLPDMTDLVQQRYVVANVNDVWTIDTTQRANVFVTTVIDLGSRYVVNALITPQQPDAALLASFLTQTFQQAGVPKTLHHDGHGLFRATLIKDLMTHLNIRQSLTLNRNGKHGNQVHESFHSRLWRYLDCLRTDLAGNAAWALLDFRQQVEFILRTIEIINNTRSSLFKAKAQQVLIAKSKYPLQTKDIIMAKKKDPTAALINQYTVFALKAAYSDLVEEYAQLVGVNTLGETQTAAETVEVEVLPPEIFQLPTFFKNASENTGNQTQSEIVQALARTKAHYFVDKTLAPVIEVLRDNVVKPIIQAIEKESQKQKESFERIQQELEQLKAKNQILIEQSLSKQRRKEALSKRVKRAPRAAITLEDYDTAQTLANSPNKIAQASDKIALCLLFLTGLRISNLRLITVGDLERFYMGSDLSVCLIKTKNGVNITYPYNKAYRHYLRQLKPEFTLFFSQKADKLRPAWDIARETLTRRINKILKKTSVVVGKNIKSHSFRIALCTEVTEAFTIRHAQQILGHANIATTERYARGTLKKQDKIKILMNVRNPIKKLRSRQEQDLDEFEESEADE